MAVGGDGFPGNFPHCAAAHLKEFDDQHWDEAPSSVTYRVETVLGAGKPVVKALSAALSCRPAD